MHIAAESAFRETLRLSAMVTLQSIYITSQLTPNQPTIPLSPPTSTQIPISKPVASRSPASRNPPCEGVEPGVCFPRNVHSSAAAILRTKTKASATRIRGTDHETTNSNPSGTLVKLIDSSCVGSASLSSPCGVLSGDAAVNRCAHCTNAYLDLPNAGVR